MFHFIERKELEGWREVVRQMNRRELDVRRVIVRVRNVRREVLIDV